MGRAQTSRDLVGLVSVRREEGLHQLRMSGLAVVALPVVLHHQLPVRGLDEIDLGCDLGPGQLVGLHVREHRCGHVVDVFRCFAGQVDVDQPGHDSHVDRPQAEARLVEARRLVAGVEE